MEGGGEWLLLTEKGVKADMMARRWSEKEGIGRKTRLRQWSPCKDGDEHYRERKNEGGRDGVTRYKKWDEQGKE